jgi:aflatoxin B1 aldehyde reductase
LKLGVALIRTVSPIYIYLRIHIDIQTYTVEIRTDVKLGMQGKMYRARFWNDEFFTAIEDLREALKREGSGKTESETALRWMMHHSQLKREFGDKVIIGASSKQQLEMNLKDFEKGALAEEVVQALEKGWIGTRGVAWKYFH